MELAVHDLVKFNDLSKIIWKTDMPNWVLLASSSQQYAVVRRQKMTELVPVGVRGRTRDERAACFISVENIEEIIKPSDLVKSIGNLKWPHLRQILLTIHDIIAPTELAWGPTGSVGFELATSIEVVHLKSDLDCVIKLSPQQLLKHTPVCIQLRQYIHTLPCRVDIQIEVALLGAILLTDYVDNPNQFLIRTATGPILGTSQLFL